MMGDEYVRNSNKTRVTFCTGDRESELSPGSIFITCVCEEEPSHEKRIYHLHGSLGTDPELSYHVEEVCGVSQAFHAVSVGQALHHAVCLVPCLL